MLTHSVLPYEIVAGVPARHLGWRFEEELRERLEKVEWWNFPMNVISENLDLFDEKVSNELLLKLESIKILLDKQN